MAEHAIGQVLGNALSNATGQARQFFQTMVVEGLTSLARRGIDMNLDDPLRHHGPTYPPGIGGRGRKFMGELEQEAAKSIPTLKDLVPVATQLVQAYGPENLGKVLPNDFGPSGTRPR